MIDLHLPDGWDWGIGERSGNSATFWFYGNDVPFRGQLFTDANQPWTAVFYKEIGTRDSGDTRVSEYPHLQGTFESEADAVDWIQHKATELRNDTDNQT